VTIPEKVDAIHSMILDNWKIFAKKKAVGYEYITGKIIDMRKLSAKWVSKYLNAVQIECLPHKQFWTNFRRILRNFLAVS
jgi:hypothetical protein